MPNKIKVGLDIHGVVSSFPEFFSNLSKILISTGNEVHIVTGNSLQKEGFLEKIKNLGIQYTHIFSVADHLIASGEEYSGTLDNPWFNIDAWDKVKGEYCLENKIDLMFDDTMAYSKHFHTPFAFLLSSCNVDHKDIYIEKLKTTKTNRVHPIV